MADEQAPLSPQFLAALTANGGKQWLNSHPPVVHAVETPLSAEALAAMNPPPQPPPMRFTPEEQKQWGATGALPDVDRVFKRALIMIGAGIRLQAENDRLEREDWMQRAHLVKAAALLSAVRQQTTIPWGALGLPKAESVDGLVTVLQSLSSAP